MTAAGLHKEQLFITGTYAMYIARDNGTVTLPADINEALAPEFNHLGYTHEDGAKFTNTPTLVKYKLTEAIGPVAARITDVESVMETKAAQYSKTSVNAAYGGGTWTATANGSRYDPPSAGAAPPTYCVVLKPVDGDNKRGVVLKSAIAGGAAVEEVYKKGEMAFLPISFLCLADDSGGPGWYQLDNITGTPTDEVQTITITGTPTSGYFVGHFDGQDTAHIAYSATATAVKNAFEALSNINVGDLTATGGPLPGTAVTLAFGGSLAGEDVPAITTTDSFGGGSSPASAVTTGTAGGA